MNYHQQIHDLRWKSAFEVAGDLKDYAQEGLNDIWALCSYIPCITGFLKYCTNYNYDMLSYISKFKAYWKYGQAWQVINVI